MINEETCIYKMVTTFPAFVSQFEKHKEYWKGEDRPFGLDMAEFSNFAIDIIRSGTDEEINALVDFAEQMILEGNYPVKQAVKFEFLENITNNNGDWKFPLIRFTKRLKPASLDFCKELDRFWGTKTNGVD